MRDATVRRLAAECGFDAAATTAAVPTSDAVTFLEWVSRGLAGRMSYLTDHRAEIRTDPRRLLPTARSIVCVARLYDPTPTGTPISRYAQGPDYHDTMRADLERLVERMHQEFGAFDSRICVDTAPLLERSYARAAGLGWIGRNTCLISQELGSWLLLGEVLTSLEFEHGVPAADRCGTCTRCIDACPTEALRPGGLRTELDSTRCISYLTIELKGDIPEAIRAGIGQHVFGCDICQEVCPWNSGQPTESDPRTSLEDLAALTAEEFRVRFRQTPVWRSKYSGFLRNVAVAMGNSGDPRFVPALKRLAAMDEGVVASHATWALSRLECET